MPTAVDCGVPPSIEHGIVNYASTNLWSWATYRCDEGFLPTGIRRRLCHFNGQWLGNNLICHGEYLHGDQIIVKRFPQGVREVLFAFLRRSSL